MTVADGRDARTTIVDRGREGDCLLTVDQGSLGSLTSSHRPLTEIARASPI